MPSRDHMMGWPQVLDATDPLPPRKPPLGRLPYKYRPPMVTVPGYMMASDEWQWSSPGPTIKFRRYTPLMRNAMLDEPVRGVWAHEVWSYSPNADSVVRADGSTVSGLQLLQQQASAETARLRELWKNKAQDAAREMQTSLDRYIYETLKAQGRRKAQP